MKLYLTNTHSLVQFNMFFFTMSLLITSFKLIVRITLFFAFSGQQLHITSVDSVVSVIVLMI